MIVKLLTEHHLEFLSLKGDRRCSSESTLGKCQIIVNLMPRLIIFELADVLLNFLELVCVQPSMNANNNSDL